MIGFSVETTGDWDRVKIVLNNLSNNILPFAEAFIDELGDMVLKKLQGHVYQQDLAWTPKKVVRATSDLWVETGELVDSFEVVKIKSGKGFTAYVGVPSGKLHSSGIPLTDLVIMLEYGTSKSPARPLFRPTWDEVKPDIIAGWREWLNNIIRSGGTSWK